MRLKANAIVLLLTVLCVQSAAAIDADDAPAATATNSVDGGNTRYGLFDWLDHRSAYTQDAFPQPFLIDDMALEDNEIELTWLHSKGGSGEQSDIGSVEFQKGIGLLTLEVEVPYERIAVPGQAATGVGNIDIGARYPIYEFVSADRSVDTTFGVAVSGGIPVQVRISENGEIEPEVFDELKLGDHFTVQAVVGYSTLLGGGDEGGTQTVEYGASFAYAIPHQQLALPGVSQFIPMFELADETELNKNDPGVNSLLGDAGFRIQLNPVGEVQPGLGLAYIFPVDKGARDELHWGFIVNMIFEF